MARRHAAGDRAGGRGIGDQVLDLQRVLDQGLLQGSAAQAAQACRSGRLNELMNLGAGPATALRHALSDLLSSDSLHQQALSSCLTPMDRVTMAVPAQVGDFSDFFTSIHHATNSGRLAQMCKPSQKGLHTL